MKIKLEYKIDSNQFWMCCRHLYNTNLDWHIKDDRIQKITKSKLGLEYLETIFSEFNDPKTNSTTFLFKVINRKKLLWAKIMYGI